MQYAFKLGHQPHISEAEISTLLPEIHIKNQQNGFLFVETDTPINTAELMHKLGGTISIHEYVGSKKDAQQLIVAELGQLPEGKIVFAVEGDKKLGLSIKRELKAVGRSVRYVEIKNTASIIHNNILEKGGHFVCINNDLYKTCSVQNIEGFKERDYDRPEVDSKSGMLPPKLARIMVNLAGADTNKTLLDPFCGSGTLLLEALDLGFSHVHGTDLSEKAISDTQANLQWFGQSQQHSATAKICDAQKLETCFEPNSIDAIATEPYMGKPLRGNERIDTLTHQAEGLATLYTKTFASFHNILSENGTVIFIIPRFKHGDDWVTIDCLEEIKKTGFAPVPFSSKHTTLLYHRKDQHVGRELFKFKRI